MVFQLLNIKLQINSFCSSENLTCICIYICKGICSMMAAVEWLQWTKDSFLDIATGKIFLLLHCLKAETFLTSCSVP